LNALLVAGLALAVVGCTSTQVDSITISPASQSLTAGQTTQFTATGTVGHGSHPSGSENVTTMVTWASSAPAVATVSSTGNATAVSTGSTSITATMPGYGGVLSASATLTVTGSTGGTAGGTLVSLTIIPTSISVGNLQDTGQFLAIGTFSTAPTVRDLTNSSTLTWISSVPSVFPVNTNTAGNLGATAGIVTAYGNGSAVIIAEAADPSNGSIQTATTTFSCPYAPPTATTPGTCYPGSQAPSLLATLTVYNEGLNNTDWLVTAPSATGTPNVLHCGPGSNAAGLSGSVCVATYPVGTTVKLTAPAGTGAAFGGWSYNCTQQGSVTAAGPNSCTVTLTTNDTVGAIFN
jgi:hypothetical protein